MFIKQKISFNKLGAGRWNPRALQSSADKPVKIKKLNDRDEKSLNKHVLFLFNFVRKLREIKNDKSWGSYEPFCKERLRFFLMLYECGLKEYLVLVITGKCVPRYGIVYCLQKAKLLRNYLWSLLLLLFFFTSNQHLYSQKHFREKRIKYRQQIVLNILLINRLNAKLVTGDWQNFSFVPRQSLVKKVSH